MQIQKILSDTELCEQRLRSRGYGDVLNAPILQRLKGVSFLAVLDIIWDISSAPSRYDHSVGVGLIALNVADRLGFSRHLEEVFVLANLLHDVGHAPFSHNAEPFLFKKKNVYHQGLTSRFITTQGNNNISGNSVTDILDERDGRVIRGVRSLIHSSKTDHILNPLFISPIKCDKIEGNNRSFESAGLSKFEPESLIQALVFKEEKFYLDKRYIERVADFWLQEKRLYWDYIYTNEVFAAEAMLTRALELCFKSRDSVDLFLNSTDRDIIRFMEQHSQASIIIDMLNNNNLFNSLSENYPYLFSSYKKRFYNAKDKPKKREDIEGEVADDIGTESMFVVSHFSLRKYFTGSVSHLYQTDMFEDSQYLRLEKVNKILSTDKKPWDFFDVFYLNE